MINSRRSVWSWAFYDWANSAFATTVMAGFFPIFYKQYWSAELEVTESSFYLGVTNSLASLVIVLLAPLLGAVADRLGRRKHFLLFFAMLGVSMTLALYFIPYGGWLLASACFALAVVGFSGSLIFYDALMVAVARSSEYDRVSALGFALGYLGGGLLFAVNVWMTLQPTVFGLADSAEAVRYSFLSVGVWWIVFSLPLILWVQDTPQIRSATVGQAVREGVGQLIATFQHIRRLRHTFLFLFAYWLYIDGVDTIIRMAVDYGLSIGLDSNHLIVALLVTQFVGFPAAIAFGRLARPMGAKSGIFLALGVYCIVIVWASMMDSVYDFYALAIMIGLVQGGVQALSRSLFARLIPPGKTAEFFGFYNMLGKFAVVLGPLLMGAVGYLTDSSRLSILTVLILFILGGLLLYKVDVEEGERQAKMETES